ncbi:MAG: hypothetical protein KY475_00890 [Planctomycetes bacterium]|nr:hypothetical protein [Planctomycetota bacterium]
MMIEVECGGCGKRLEVDPQYAGQTAECPVCQTPFQVPDPAAEAGPAEPATWRLKTPEGRTYGPVARSELDRWVSEGRVSHDCELREEGQPWARAERMYPVLTPGMSGPPSRGNPFAPAPFYARAAPAPGSGENGRPVYLKPHRGGLILALGILAFVVACPVLSFLAWTMGTADLREMREGRMDPSGMGRTQAGMVLGMLLSVAAIIGLMGLTFFVIFRIAL